jgi:hypothetical protein
MSEVIKGNEEMRLDEKRALAAKLLQKKKRESQAYPLSFAQQRLWFLNRLMPENPSYNAPIGVRLKGSLDIRALELSLNDIIDRHEALRTSFVTSSDRPAQIISS